MGQPVWQTASGSLGTIAEGIFYQTEVLAVDPDGGTVYYTLIAGELPEGIQVRINGSVEGTPVPFSRVQGVPSEVGQDVVSTFALRAYTINDGITRINDRTFSITVTGQDLPTFQTPAGSLGTFYDGEEVNITIEFSDQDPGDTVTISVEDGELPPGLTLSSSGVISGYIIPQAPLPDTAVAGFDTTLYDQFPFDFNTRSISKNYQFTVQITDGKDINLRTYTIYVVSRDSLTADSEDLTADTMLITADVTAKRVPIIVNYPTNGNIGTFRHDNFFAYQFQGLDLDGDPIEYEIAAGDSGDIPPNLIFDRDTGWLTGFFPDQGATELSYSFAITVYKKDDNSIVSDPYQYTMTVIGDIETAITWTTGTQIGTTSVFSLGTINNGATSLLYVNATSNSNRTIFYRLKQGSSGVGTYNKLPQGLELLPSGNIVGRVSFNGFAIDGGTTTFDEVRSTRLDVEPTTFDSDFTFTVEAYSVDGLISVFRTFKIAVNRAYNSPYESLYIQAMPDSADRNLITTLLQNNSIFNPEYIYRPDDPYFGIANNVQYVHAFSLNTATLEEYVRALQLNHFRKRLILGEIKTAQAVDSDGNIIYEVVYSEIVDTGVNKQGQSPPQSVKTAYPFTPPDDSTETQTVYPNSLINMRDQVIDTVGRTSQILPLWMTSKQQNGQVLGFTKAWVLAYTLPQRSAEVAYFIRQDFGETLNRIDWVADRYILDKSLTKNWVPNEDSTDGGNWLPAKLTTFDRNDEYSLSLTNGGENYSVGDTLAVGGNNLGGSAPSNDLSITVTSIKGIDIVTIDNASDSSDVYEVGDSVEAVSGGSIISQGTITAISTDRLNITVERQGASNAFTGEIRLTADPGINNTIVSTDITSGIIVGFDISGTASYTARGNTYTNVSIASVISSGSGAIGTVTIADETTFDGDSLRFTSPVDKYEFTDEYNKYLVFPKTNILG